MCLTMFKQGIIDRESNAFSPIKDASLKYVISLDLVDMSHNGVIHLNIIDRYDLILS